MGVPFNPTENVYYIRTAADLPDELSEFVLYHCAYDAGWGPGIYFYDGTDLLPASNTDRGWFDNLSTFNSAKVAGANVPSWDAFRGGIYAYTFSPTSMNEVWMSFHINHDYKMGTDIYPHIHFVPFATGAGVVRWGVEYTVAKGHSQQAFPATDTVYIEHTVADGSTYLHIVAEADEANTIPADNIEPDSLIQVRIFRDAAHANDTYASKVYALNADLHYQRDRGATPNKAPDFYA